MAEDPLQARFRAVAHQQIENLPYALDASATDLLNARIESGVAAMRDAKRTGNDDVALAERHLRGLLQTVKSRAMLSSSGETVVVAEGLESVFPSNKWWPF